MNNWQVGFIKRLDKAREYAQDLFDQHANKLLIPTFEDFSQFMAEHGIIGTVLEAGPGACVFQFALSEHTRLILEFKSVGLDQCEVNHKFLASDQDTPDGSASRVSMASLNIAWTRHAFEQALDRLLDVISDSLACRTGAANDLVEA